jgi:LuxR family transcriptional regulator, maltose regulon positive regulatory protein
MTQAAQLDTASQQHARSWARLRALPPLAPAVAAPIPSDETIVARPRLFERLEKADRVALVSAPAGSGKTSLLRSWIREAGLESTAAWLPVGHLPRDPQRFWICVLDALRQTEAGSALLGEVTAAPDADGWELVERLRAELECLERPLWLFIDDLDELEGSETAQQLKVLLARAPAKLRFAFSTRRHLPLGLHRLRLAGRLSELRGGDLRFSVGEARALFAAVGAELPECSLACLVERTEGWAAGLRLAAISLTGHPDPERFVREFSGSERTVAEYLLSEVLEREPADVRDLLLRTSVLERVSGPLADYLTGRSGSERILQELEDANAMVTSLDVGRSWFRYHGLFADLLQLELRRVSPDAVVSLHRAAGQWFEEHGETVEAVRHAKAARDWRHAAHLLFESRTGLILDGGLATVRGLLEGFPARMTEADPELALTVAEVRLWEGAFDQVDLYLAAASQQAAGVLGERKALFEMHLASVRLALARHRADLDGALDAMLSLESALEAQTPRQLASTNDVRALALLNLGATEVWALRLEDARRHLEEGLTLARRIERRYLEIGFLAHLGIAAPLSGLSPSTALDYSERAVAVAEEHGLGTDPIVALAAAVGGGSLAILGRLAEAEHWLDRAERAVRPQRDPGTALALYHARGLLRAGQGRSEDALAAFRRAEALQPTLAGEHALTVDVLGRIVQLMVGLGESAAARTTLNGMAKEERERAEIRNAAAAVELAEGNPQEAVALLGPVIDRSANALHSTSAAIIGLLFDALAHEQLGDRTTAEASLERALGLAEPEGIILPFVLVDVREIVERVGGHRTAHGGLRRTILDVVGGASPGPRGKTDPLVEELSQAELRVLRYLPSNLRMSEIAAELFVSKNTVRAHVRHIYAKLAVHGRAEAVARARELGLLAPSTIRR